MDNRRSWQFHIHRRQQSDQKKGSTETGTYEVTDDDILIMHFKKEDLSYLLETSSDGTVKWVHSYNGFEEVIIPNTIQLQNNIKIHPAR